MIMVCRAAMALQCSHFEKARCRSCSAFNAIENYPSRKLALFREKVEETLGEVLVKPLFSPSRLLGSRSKAKLSVGGTLERPVIGLPGGLSNLVDCPLHDDRLNRVVQSMPALIQEFKLFPYNIEARRGELKGLILKLSQSEGTILLRFVLRTTEPLLRLKKAIRVLSEEHPEVQVISANLHPDPSAILEGKEERLLSEKSLLKEQYGPHALYFAPQSFSQVTFESALFLYQAVADIAERVRPKRLWDLFCGVGGFSRFCAPFVQEGWGVEISEGAISAAQFGAREAGLYWNFVAGDIEAFLDRGLPKPEMVVVNPPKRGLGPRICQKLQRVAPEVIVYSSCHAGTLLADLQSLKDYSIKGLQPIDMFPLTDHLEVLAELHRKA